MFCPQSSKSISKRGIHEDQSTRRAGQRGARCDLEIDPEWSRSGNTRSVCSARSPRNQSPKGVSMKIKALAVLVNAALVAMAKSIRNGQGAVTHAPYVLPAVLEINLQKGYP